MLDRELGSQWEDEAIKDREERIEEGKGLFLSLSALVILLFSLFMAFIWYMIKPRLFEISPSLLTISGILISLFIIYTIIKFVLTVISAATGKNILLSFTGDNHNAIKLIYSYSVRIGKILGISIDRIGNSFVNFNNSLVRALRRKIGRENLLVLLPRCIQYSGCKQRVTEDISNCKDCGKCEITEFKSLGRRYGFYVSVATGGSLARKMIYRIRPSTILAVACERELVSGIQDTGKVRVLAVPNWRPEGPCKNTKVDMEKVKDAIEFIFGGENSVNLKKETSGAIVEAGV